MGWSGDEYAKKSDDMERVNFSDKVPQNAICDRDENLQRIDE